MPATIGTELQKTLPQEPPGFLAEPRLSENALTVLERRYLLKGEEGRPVETPRALFWRVARTVAATDLAYGASVEAGTETAVRFYRLVAEQQFVPNSPTLMNAGRPLGQLSACFVLPVEDSLDGIYETLKHMALIHQSGGGTGFGFSRLRPRGDVVRSTMGVASGPVSFMEVYDASTEAVKQGGTRRGANMGILRVDHPDILEFIDAKRDKRKITNFNISVAITDAFMRSVEAGVEYDLVNPRTGRVVKRLPAREVFDRIVQGAWRNGEPGVFFIDAANRCNPVPHLGAYEATNPCGEQPLLAYDVCNLGSINVARFAADGGIDWDGLRACVHASTHFLDNVIDANNYPLDAIADLSRRIRRIGLGVMGWADLLVRVEVPYGSEESIGLAHEVMEFVDEESKRASEALAAERGVFPEWPRSTWGPDETCVRAPNGERIHPMRRLRNCNLTTVAPTGTISILAGCSSGIEPLFAVAFMRNQAGVLMPDVNPDFVAIAKRDGWYSEDLMRRIAEEGHIHFPEVPDSVQRVFVTAHDVTPEQHIRMQAAFQSHVDSAISKTCNFAEDATQDDVRKIYQLAFALGCKGVTVYRDGSRDAQVLSTGKTAKRVAAEAGGKAMGEADEGSGGEQYGGPASPHSIEPAEWIEELARAQEEIARLSAETERLRSQLAVRQSEYVNRPFVRERPSALRGLTRKIISPLGTIYVTINEDDKGRPFEVFAALGKAGGAAMADAEAIGRLISLALRSGVPMKEVWQQLRGISCDRAVGFGEKKVLSMPDAIAQALEQYLAEKEGTQQSLPLPDPTQPKKLNGGRQASAPPRIGVEPPATFAGRDTAAFINTCPECRSSQLEFAEGCMKCHVCGYTECG